jgi:hypothetical protein
MRSLSMPNTPPPVHVNRALVLTLWATVVAERLVEHLERSGYVVMHKPPLGQHGAPRNLAGWIEKATSTDRSKSVRMLSGVLALRLNTEDHRAPSGAER